jgi:ATP synthase protein I
MTVTFETPAVEIVTTVRSQVGESPLWSVGEQALWWVDIEGRLLHRLDPASAQTTTWPVDERIGCIGLHRDGGFIAALETGIFRLDPQADGALVGERLATANRPSENGSGPRQTADRASAFARGFRLSTELVAGVLVGAVIGWLIDRWLGISPWGLIVFLLLGFAAGVLNVMRAAGVVRERKLDD